MPPGISTHHCGFISFERVYVIRPCLCMHDSAEAKWAFVSIWTLTFQTQDTKNLRGVGVNNGRETEKRDTTQRQWETGKERERERGKWESAREDYLGNNGGNDTSFEARNQWPKRSHRLKAIFGLGIRVCYHVRLRLCRQKWVCARSTCVVLTDAHSH